MSIVEKAADRLKRQNEGHARIRPDEQGDVDRRETVSNASPSAQRRRVELDEVSLRRAGMIPPDSMGPWINRELQRIKRPILNAMNADVSPDESSPNRLLVTSANPGEGKSFISFNLALSLANELDHSVLLIDGDIAKPKISSMLGLQGEPGLMHLLDQADTPIEDCVVATSEPRLSILPAGRRSHRAAESLSSRRMRDVLDELSADPSRILLFDSAPLLATAESQALALHVGQILFVVRAEHTEKGALNAALSLVEPSNAQISLILSQGRRSFDDRYAGYYGMYYADSERSE